MGLKQFFYNWIEQYLFFPNPFQRLVSICFFPLTIIYCIIVAYKRNKAKPIDYGIKIISIGNLVVGGTGKTPITIALAKNEKNVAIILRGYGRESKGLYIVSRNGKILESVQNSGDEAQVLARSLPNATVIVCENRIEAILKAKELKIDKIYLDDGYSSHHIKKFDILLRPAKEPTNLFCLPSGGYRETKMMYSFVPLVLQEDKDFQRIVTFKQNGKTIDTLPDNIVLLTAISKPNRLLQYLPQNIKTEFFQDHYNFTQNNITKILQTYKDYYIITTLKDFVKLEQFKIPKIILLDLEIKFLIDIKKKIDD